MTDPELRTPEQWAETLRDAAQGGSGDGIVCCLSASKSCVIADRFDDLAEALRLLREMGLVGKHAAIDLWNIRRDALLAKYQED